MNIRNKVAAASALVLAAGVLVSCGSSGTVGGSESAEQVTDGEITLSYWTWFPPQATLETVIAAFEDENPNITVELRTFEAAEYQKQLPLALSGGEAIDVVGVQVSAMTAQVQDYVLPVDEWAGDWLSKVNQPMRDQTAAKATDGVLYSVPMGSIGSPLMYYNAALLDELGLTVPGTATEWKAAVDAIAAAKPGVTPVVFSGEPWWQEEMFFGVAEQQSPGLSDDIFFGDGAWDQPAVIEGLKAYKSLFDDGIVSTDVLSLLGARPSEMFAAGEAAFYVDGSWQTSLLSPEYRESNGINVEDVGVAPLPLVDGGAPSVRALAEGGLAIPASSTHQKAAATFIEFMTVGGGTEIWGKDLILVPSLEGYELPDGVLESAAAIDGFSVAAEVIAAPTSRRDGQQDFLNQIEGNAILDVLRGTMSAEDAAAKMQAEWTSGRYPHGSDQ